MAKSTRTDKETAVAITRIFDAPRELLWKAWTEPERARQWFGPREFTMPVYKIDLRIGGKSHSAMQGPDGKLYWSTGVYREIVPLERLVMTDSFADEKGNVVPATYYGMSADWPIEMLVTVTFEPRDGKTRMVLKHSGLAGMPEKDRSDMRQGWAESFDKLAESLESWKREAGGKRATIIAEPGKQEFFTTREFDAPRALVFKAFVDPVLLKQWLGPRKLSMTVEKLEPSGGSWRFVYKDKAGNEYGFHGVTHEVNEPSRMIRTFEFEGLPETGHVSLETAKFEELPGGRTRLTVQTVFQSVADRAGMIGSGMEQGTNESYERLDELLKKMKKTSRR